MKIKNEKTNIVLIMLFSIVVILTLLILSVKTNAAPVQEFSEIADSGDLARWVAYNPIEFMNKTPSEIFALNNVGYDNSGSAGLPAGPAYESLTGNNVMPTLYALTMCMWHSQNNGIGTGHDDVINIVDIETPGQLTVYRNGVKDSKTATLTNSTEKKSIAAFTYMLYQANLYKREKSGNSWNYSGSLMDQLIADSDIDRNNYLRHRELYNNNDVMYKIKVAIADLFLRDFDGEKDMRVTSIFRKYFGSFIDDLYTGLMDGKMTWNWSMAEVFGNGEGSPVKLLAEAESVAENYVTDPKLEKEETVPVIEVVGENAYIGPLAVNYAGGETSISIEGVSSEKILGWARKNTDGEFKDIQKDSLTQNDTTPFYIVVNSEAINSLSTIKMSVSLNYDVYKARLVLTTNKQGTNQNLIHYAAIKDTNTLSVDWTIEQGKEVSIQKVDSSSNPLKVEGIKFYVYNSSNTYIGCLETDKDGKTKTLKLAKGQEYTIKEMQNNLYGFKGCTISDAEIVSGEGTITVNNGEAKVTIAEDSVIAIENQPELGEIIIHKTRQDGKDLEGVEFVLWKGNSYLKLNEESVTTPIVTSDDGLDITKYNVTTVKTPEEATKFSTNASGKIIIKNLEIYSGKDTKYNYWLEEFENDNYAYKGMSMSEEDVTVTGGNKLEVRTSSRQIKFDITNSTTVKINNTPNVGNLKLEKVDDSNSNIKLEDVGFAIEISPAPEKSHAYLALYDKDGKIVPSIKGTATININNEATDDGKEYEVSYYCTDKVISELSDEEKANITTFVTESNGTLTVNNLEVYSSSKKDKYEYKLIETSNSNYGFEVDWTELGNVTLEPNKTTEVILGNTQKYIKLSGYVWIENPAGKTNNYNGLYTQEGDMKLTDLYVIKDGRLIKNPEAVTPVEIKLRNKTTGEFIKQLPDEFDNETGKYTFNDILVEELVNYEVVFVYDGFYYTTVVPQIDKENGSKAQESSSDRATLNNKFATLKDNSEVISADGTVNTVEYYKDGHTSTVSKLNFDTTVSATTTISETEYNLRKAFDALKVNAKELTNELPNVNMGIVLREQPQISLNSDIYSVLLEFEGHTYNYKYNGRQNYYESIYGEEFGVKFEEKFAQARYTRTVYASDVKAAKDLNKQIKVAVTYKIRVENQSRTLTVLPKQIINYFDSRYEVKAVGLELNEETHIATNTLSFTTPQNVEGNSEYKSTVIDFNQKIVAGNENKKDLYITFDIQRDAIIDLLNNKSTYHNASEILSYASMYGAETAKVDGVQFMTETTKAGEIYAGIDKMSQPGNVELKLVDHSSGDGTKVLDTTNFEDDTASAPSLLLEATESRKVSGTIFEDTDTGERANEKIGDGKYNDGEKPIQNVKVELHKLNEDGSIGDVATYSNGYPIEAVTDQNGNYTFGKYEENPDGTIKECYGILPGRYVVQYTYNNESFIVDSNRNKNLNVNDYKSTVITSEVIKNAFSGQNERWYIVDEGARYSDARDDISLRPEYDSNIDQNITVTNSTYNNILSIDTMNAITPVMDIGIEFTEANEADAISMVRKVELKNIDFGIIERPDVEITIEKEITSLEIVASNGTNIIPKGDPSDLNSKMQYVKKLDGLVSAEIEAKLLQGAKLNMEYTITVVNNSDKDYLHADYYYYGIARAEYENTATAKQVVDYLSISMPFEQEQNEEWTEKTVDYLYNAETQQGFINTEVYNELKTGNYRILTTEAFNEVGAGSEKSVKLYTTKALAVSDSLREENSVEIIEITGRRTIKDSIPGNYNPATNGPDEIDDDYVDAVITPPTGTTVNYIVYIIAALATFAILVSGIVIIKKKIIK